MLFVLVTSNSTAYVLPLIISDAFLAFSICHEQTITIDPQISAKYLAISYPIPREDPLIKIFLSTKDMVLINIILVCKYVEY